MSVARPFSLNTHLFNPTLYSRILTLWFADLPLPASAPNFPQTSRWFGVGASPPARAAFDAECYATVQDAIHSISSDKFTLPVFKNTETDRSHYAGIAAPFVGQFSAEDEIEKRSKTALGLVLLLDQMPRNCFRGDQKVVYGQYDRISRAVAQEIYARGLDKSELYRDSPPWRIWFYMPLMHSEAKGDHEILGQILGDMKAQAEERGDKAAIEYMGTTLDFEKKHVDLLMRFGRYPYRNKVLGRQSTAEEQEWLDAGGDTFGA